MKRRDLLHLLALSPFGGVAAANANAPAAPQAQPDSCAAPLPADLARHELVTAAWDGIEPARVWDAHSHLVGTGGSGGGASVHPDTMSWRSPLERARRLLILDAACIDEEPDATLDARYVARLRHLLAVLPAGVKLLLFAFDHACDEQGVELPSVSTFHVPNAYAAAVAHAGADRFEWVASIHPYRPDALDRLDAAAAAGARGVKWLPSSMNIDPGSARCDAFYCRLVQHKLPLTIHCGEELAAPGARQEALNNPLLLRRPLEAGVRVVAAHAASLGYAKDFEAVPGSRDPAAGPSARSFHLFARLMDDKTYAGRLFADISAVFQRNRELDVAQTLLARKEWHARLLHGSDYPVPGIRLAYRLRRFVDAQMLDAAAAPALERLQRHNPLLFDWVLKRTIHHQGARLPVEIFHTREFFAPQAHAKETNAKECRPQINSRC
jgi:mannonate dehydratase